MKALIVVFMLLISFSIQAVDVEQIASAIYMTEGGAKTRYPYGVMAGHTLTTSEARQYALNSINHSYIDWRINNQNRDFITYLASTYCPGTDKETWIKNVNYFLKHPEKIVIVKENK